MSINVGDLEGVLTRYSLLLDKWSESGELVTGWAIDYGDERVLVDELYEEVLELQGAGASVLVKG